MVTICFSLMVNSVEHLFMCLGVNPYILFCKVRVQSFRLLSLRLGCYHILWLYGGGSYILDKSFLFDIGVANIFSQTVA